MKKRIVAGLLLASMVLSVPDGGKAANENYINQDHIESDLLILIAEENDNYVGYSTVNENTWYIGKDDNYDLGDIIAVSRNNNGTKELTDDVIISDAKAGSTKHELSKDKKVVDWFSFDGRMYSQEDFN